MDPQANQPTPLPLGQQAAANVERQIQHFVEDLQAEIATAVGDISQPGLGLVDRASRLHELMRSLAPRQGMASRILKQAQSVAANVRAA